MRNIVFIALAFTATFGCAPRKSDDFYVMQTRGLTSAAQKQAAAAEASVKEQRAANQEMEKIVAAMQNAETVLHKQSAPSAPVNSKQSRSSLPAARVK